MARVRIVDDSVWFRHIDGDEPLRQRLQSLKAGDAIDLSVDGVRGRWVRMQDGRDGRPTLGIKPVADMKDVWARWRKEPPRIVDIHLLESEDSYLTSVGALMTEWNTKEDEEAFGDL